MRLLQRVRNVLDQSPNERSRLWPAGLAALALPLGIWAAAAYNSTALADDDDKKPAIKRETEERVQTRRLQREKPEAGRRVEGENRVEVEVEKERREGQNPEVTEIYTVVRDGKPGEERIERRIVTRDGKPVVMESRNDKQDTPSDRRIDELTALVKQLSRNVERLQDEVSRMRGQKEDEKPSKERGTSSSTPAVKRQTTTSTELELRNRAIQQEQEKIEAVKRDVEAQAHAIAQKAQAIAKEGETHARAIAEKTRKEAEALQHAAEDKKEEALRLRLKKQAEDKRGATEQLRFTERAVVEQERSKEDAPRLKTQIRPGTIIDTRDERSADREKARQEIKMLEQKLRELKSGQLTEFDLEVDDQLNPKLVNRRIREQQALLSDAKPRPSPAKAVESRGEPQKPAAEQEATP